jgi:sigma-B regulation protein RsbU (phosphoserine phosphatase)
LLDKYLQEILFAIDEDYEINLAAQSLSRLTGKDHEASIGTLCYEELMGRSEPCLNCPMKKGKDSGEVLHDVILTGGERRFYLSTFAKDKDNDLLVESMSDITVLQKDSNQLRHEMKKLKAEHVAGQLKSRTMQHDYNFLLNAINKQTYGLMAVNRSHEVIVLNTVLRDYAEKKTPKHCYEIYGKSEPCSDCPFDNPDVRKTPRDMSKKNMTVTYGMYDDHLVESVRDTTREIQLINEIRISQNEVQEKQRQMELLNKDLLRMNSDLKVVQAMIDEEFQKVGQIQQSLLPETLPEIAGYEFSAFYTPTEHAGGDYYDCIEMSNNHWGFAIADVSGHGAPAAVIMAMSRSIMRSYTYDVASSADALSMVNEILCDNVHSNDFVTMFYTVMDSKTGKLNYASAGHNPMLHFDKSEMMVRTLTAGGMFLAAFPGVEYEECSVQLDEGDILFMYTDGLVEAMNPRREQYTMDRVISHLIMYANSSCEEIVSEIMADVRRFAENTPFEDDVTILVMKKN